MGRLANEVVHQLVGDAAAGQQHQPEKAAQTNSPHGSHPPRLVPRPPPVRHSVSLIGQVRLTGLTIPPKGRKAAVSRVVAREESGLSLAATRKRSAPLT